MKGIDTKFLATDIRAGGQGRYRHEEPPASPAGYTREAAARGRGTSRPRQLPLHRAPRIPILLIVLLCMWMTSGCYAVSYKYPATSGKPTARRPDTLYYQILPVPQLSFGGGYDQLRASFRANPVFARSEASREPPAGGVFVRVHTQVHDMSMPALAWGYISLSTLHILPAYSGSGGFDVRFHLFVDGAEVALYEYPVRRRIFAWLPLVVFVWVNLVTSSEADAFAAVSRQFFIDATRDQAFDRRGETPPNPGSPAAREAPVPTAPPMPASPGHADEPSTAPPAPPPP